MRADTVTAVAGPRRPGPRSQRVLATSSIALLILSSPSSGNGPVSPRGSGCWQRPREQGSNQGPGLQLPPSRSLGPPGAPPSPVPAPAHRRPCAAVRTEGPGRALGCLPHGAGILRCMWTQKLEAGPAKKKREVADLLPGGSRDVL